MASTMNPTPDDTADRLIERAAEILAEQGPDSLSIRRVAAAAGTSTMAVYTHFGSKADLVRAVVDRGFARLATELAAVPRTDDSIADFAHLGQAYRAMALDNAHLYRVMFSRNPLGFGDPSHASGIDDGDADPHEAIGLQAFGHLVSAVRRVLADRSMPDDRSTEAGAPGHGSTSNGSASNRSTRAESLTLGIWGLVHGCVDLELAGFLDDGAAAIEAVVSTMLVTASDCTCTSWLRRGGAAAVPTDRTAAHGTATAARSWSEKRRW